MYQQRIRKTADGSFFAMIVRVDRDGFEQVVGAFKARHFASIEAAEKAVQKYIASI